MGHGRWEERVYSSYTASASSKTREEIFTSHHLNADLDPSKILVREAVDSAENPSATPIILGVDETGSMGRLAEIIIRTGLGTIMKRIYDHKPVPDPQILCMGLGDAECDQAPIQVTQFEAAVAPMTKQIEAIWLEGAGGGNNGESYPLAWWFAVNKTTCDAIVKRGRKGYLFTIGDECPLPILRRDQIQRFLGGSAQSDVAIADLLKECQQFWHVFHLIVKPVANQPVVQTWTNLLGDHAIPVQDENLLPDVIVALIRITEGQTNVTDDLDHNTALVVRDATKHLVTA